MVAKIILSLGHTILRELPLLKDRITIGRAPQNDLVIDDPVVSAEHAVIITAHDGFFLEDLNSTNGTQINGQPVGMHFLQDRDEVTLARYTMLYLAGDPSDLPLLPESSHAAGNIHSVVATIKLKVADGSEREIDLSKPLTTIGLPGSYIAVIAKNSGVYTIARVEGNMRPLLNGYAIDDTPESLKHGDLIRVGNNEMMFLLQ